MSASAPRRKSYLTFSDEFPDGENLPYELTVPVNAAGRVQGFEIAYQQAINENFGFAANYTYADGEQTSVVTTGVTTGWSARRRTRTT